MNAQKRQNRRSRRFNCLLLALTLVTWTAVVSAFWVRSTIIDMERLKMNVTATGELRFYSVSAGPYIITHLVYEDSRETGRITAALPQPLLFDESGGLEMTRAQIATLKWIDSDGGRVAAPGDLSKIRAIYYPAQSLSTSV